MPDPTIGGTPEESPALSPSLQQPAFDTGVTRGAAATSQTNAADARADGPAAASVTGQAKQRLAGALDERKGMAADKVEELAETVQRSAEQFQGRQHWIASAIGRGAEELNMLAGSLRETDVSDLMAQIQSFARRQPALFAGAAFAAGFAVARIGKLVAGDVSREDLPTMPEVDHGQR